MSNKQKKSWLENNTLLKVFSLCAAMVFWVFVAMTDSAEYQQSFRRIPVDAEPQADVLTALGLNTIEISVSEVEAIVYGERGVVSRLKSEDLAATIEIPRDLSTAGIYDLTLTPIDSGDGSYRVEYAPSQVRVNLDRLVRQSFDVEPQIVGLSVPSGYLINEEYTLTPSRVEVSGPQVELDKIDRAVIEVSFTEALESTHAGEYPITLLDAQGSAIDTDARHLTLSQSSAQLIVTVLREKELPLILEFTNVPRGFPLEDLDYSMSNYEVMVAGPVDMVGRYQELVVGVIDLREVTADNATFHFDVELPVEQLVNMDGINLVTVEFNTSGWSEAHFTLSDITLINLPTRYEVELITDTLYDVVIVGSEEILEELTAADIVAEVDFSERDLVEGQQRYPVKISIPGKGLVWATGGYTVVVQAS